MKLRVLSVVLLTLALQGLFAQEDEADWGIKFSGFVKTDAFMDTRTTASSTVVREGHFYLFPDNVSYDSAGNDINANPSFHILNIQTRLKGTITGPDAFGAKTSGVIEAEFFGTSTSDINGFRLRHAFVKLDWSKASLLIGQTWHPMFPSESYPGTISFNTGAPFTPFSRNPQIRITGNIGAGSISLTAYTQRDFTSTGPDGSSNKYMRNSMIPGLNLQLRIPVGAAFSAWANVNYITLRPELISSKGYETDTKISGLAASLAIKIKTAPITFSAMGFYGQNATDLMMLGGYAVSDTADTDKGYKDYANLKTSSIWGDLSTNGKKVSVGVFAGYTKNLGAGTTIEGPIFGRGTNIDHVFRISPRIVFTQGKLSIATEVERTTAAYGVITSDASVEDTENVCNLRVLLSAIYRF